MTKAHDIQGNKATIAKPSMPAADCLGHFDVGVFALPRRYNSGASQVTSESSHGMLGGSG